MSHSYEIPRYEVFPDPAYFDMWCCRSLNDRRFDSPMAFHFALEADANELKRLLELAK